MAQDAGEKMKNNDNIPFLMKRLERLLIVMLGRMGVWKYTFYILNKLQDQLKKLGI